MSESAAFHRAIQALRVPDGQLPILMATLETFPNPTSVESLKALTIKCTKLIEENRILPRFLRQSRRAEMTKSNPTRKEPKCNSPMNPGRYLCYARKRPRNHGINRETRKRPNRDLSQIPKEPRTGRGHHWFVSVAGIPDIS